MRESDYCTSTQTNDDQTNEKLGQCAPACSKILPAATRCFIVAAFVSAYMSAGACAQKAQSQASVDRAVTAMGGEDVLRGIQTLRTVESHTTFRLTDSDHPEGPFLVQPTDYTKFIDVQAGLAVVKTDAHVPDGSTQSAITIYRNSIVESRLSLTATTYRTQTMPVPENWSLASPIAALRAALVAPDLHKIGSTSMYGVPHTVVGFTHDGQPVSLELNDQNGYIDAITRRVSSPYVIAMSVWGDYQLRTVFGDWRLQKGGLHYPFLATTYFDGLVLETDQTQTLDINPQNDPLAQFLASPQDPKAIQAPNVDDIPLSSLNAKANGNPGSGPVEILPGVLQLPGNWYTTVVRQDDGLLIIDAPISSGYSKQVIQKAKERFSKLPIKGLVTSTSYWWHFAGIREYAAEGIPIYVLDTNEKLISDALAAPHITRPDDLARSNQKPKLISVSHETTIGSGPNRITLYPIRRATGQMMMTWFPESHLLYTAEMAQPLGEGHTFLYPQSLWELMQSVDSLHLPVNKIIGMHMSPTDWSLVVKTVQAAIAGEPAPRP